MTVLSGCGGGGGGRKSPSGVFDDFESYSLSNPWTPQNNWENENGGVTWTIMLDSGSQVLRHNGDSGYLITSKFSGSDYTVSAKVKPGPSLLSTGIVARYNIEDENYSLCLESQQLLIRKTIGGTNYSYAAGALDYRYDSSTYYTLTLKVNGIIITGTVSDGVTEDTITLNDDGSFNGAALGTGQAGVIGYGDTESLFDDFTVTSP